MSNASDFVIENGVLKKYVGPGGDVVIPQGVTVIGSEAFWNCNGLISVTIPDGVTSIGTYAFRNCSNLIRVSIPESVTWIGDKAFHGCKGLADADGFVIVRSVLYYYCGPGGDVVVPSGVASIDAEAFYGCNSITSVTIPDGVTSIGRQAFKLCESLKSVTIPKGVTNISCGVFLNCSSLTSITIPEGVISIERWAFKGCRSLTSITLPNSLTSIWEEAFSGCSRLMEITIPDQIKTIGTEAFKGCQLKKECAYIVADHKLLAYIGSDRVVEIPDDVTSIDNSVFNDGFKQRTIVLPHGIIANGEKLQAALTKMDLRVEEEDYSLIALYQSGKAWDKWLGERVNDPVKVFEGMIHELKSRPELASKAGANVASFIMWYHERLPKEQIESMLSLFTGIKCAKIDELKNSGVLTAYLEQTDEKKVADNPIESEVRNNLIFGAVPAPVDIQRSVEKGIKYADTSEICSKQVLQYLIWLSIKAWDNSSIEVRGSMSTTTVLTEKSVITIDPLADRIAAALDRKELSSYFEQHVLPEKKYRRYLIAWAKYADDSSVARVTAKYGKFAKGNAKEKYFANSLKYALLINETRTAMIFADKVGTLYLYASMRGMEEDMLRDSIMSDIGLDEQRGKNYDLGNQTVIARLQKDLSFLIELPDGKTAKSLPKKGADPDKYEAANKDFSEMKKSVKKILKNRGKMLFADFLDGRARPSAEWQSAYTHNPLLWEAASLIVWDQDKATFTLNETGPVDSAENPYAITDKEIKVAHPMEMMAADTAAWQKYFTSHGLKQPFAQVWEPVHKSADIKGDRYSGCMIPYYRFINQEKRGITVTDYDFHNQIDISIQGCNTDIARIDWARHEITMNDRFEIQRFSFSRYTRRVNHIVAYFDRVTVWDRVRKDDVSVMDLMPGFTLAQITEFITAAQEANATNVLAALLEYKNANFADFDPMDEFTLEW